MNKPTIEINGKTFEIIEVKARMWRKFAEFDSKKKNIPAIDFVDEYAKFLAEWFDGVTADDILDYMPLGKIANVYRACSDYLIALLNGKFDELEKNVDGGETAAE